MIFVDCYMIIKKSISRQVHMLGFMFVKNHSQSVQSIILVDEWNREISESLLLGSFECILAFLSISGIKFVSSTVISMELVQVWLSLELKTARYL